MIELVLFVCLATDPKDCRREAMPWDGPMMACALHGQQAAVDWLAVHPLWRLSRWSCGPVRRAV